LLSTYVVEEPGRGVPSRCLDLLVEKASLAIAPDENFSFYYVDLDEMKCRPNDRYLQRNGIGRSKIKRGESNTFYLFNVLVDEVRLRKISTPAK
jgi:hypothetical protein